MVTWLTMNKTDGVPTVHYAEPKDFLVDGKTTLSQTGIMTEFTDEGKLKMKRYVYRVKLPDMKPNTIFRK